MTNKTINGAPRDLLERVIESAGVRDDSPYFMDGIKELRALLAAPDPIVEADGIGEPVYLVRTHGSCCWEEISGESLEFCQAEKEEYEVIKLYSADQLSALQSTIAQLKAENERLRGIPEGWKLVPVQPTMAMIEAAINTPVPDTGNDEEDQPEDYRNMWRAMLNACLDEVRRMNP